MTSVITVQSRVIAKILEKIVSVQLSGYLESNHLFHPHQGAGKSTEDILQLNYGTAQV